MREDLSNEQVAETIGGIVANGEVVSVRSIRQRIGGSNSTISKLWKAYREQSKQIESATTERAPLPEPVMAAFIASAKAIWQAAQGVSQDELDGLAQTLNCRTSEAEMERDSALKDAEKADDELRTADGRIAELERAMTEASANLLRHIEEAELLRSKLQNSEWRVSIAEVEVDAIRKQNASGSADLKAIKKMVAQLAASQVSESNGGKLGLCTQ
jgi:chromosome segregation ATPase